jgi:hypothetical protein
MFPTVSRSGRDAAILDEGTPDVDVQAPSRHPEEPKRSSQTPLKVLKGHTKASGDSHSSRMVVVSSVVLGIGRSSFGI